MAGQNIYMECYSGASGDMIVAALLDLGADKEVLLSGLKSLNISGYRIEISRLKKTVLKLATSMLLWKKPALIYRKEIYLTYIK